MKMDRWTFLDTVHIDGVQQSVGLTWRTFSHTAMWPSSLHLLRVIWPTLTVHRTALPRVRYFAEYVHSEQWTACGEQCLSSAGELRHLTKRASNSHDTHQSDADASNSRQTARRLQLGQSTCTDTSHLSAQVVITCWKRVGRMQRISNYST